MGRGASLAALALLGGYGEEVGAFFDVGEEVPGSEILTVSCGPLGPCHRSVTVGIPPHPKATSKLPSRDRTPPLAVNLPSDFGRTPVIEASFAKKRYEIINGVLSHS